MSVHYSVLDPADGYVEIKGSKFIARLLPYAQYHQALEVAQCEHAKASHIIPVFRHTLDAEHIHEGSSDDGEPSGTAGRPVLAVVQGAKLVNVGLYVVRYFGGTKLGTGPLARAYAASARAAVEAATLTPWEPWRTLRASVPYADIARMELEVRQMEPVDVDRVHTARGVDFVFSGVKSLIDRVEARLIEARVFSVD